MQRRWHFFLLALAKLGFIYKKSNANKLRQNLAFQEISQILRNFHEISLTIRDSPQGKIFRWYHCRKLTLA